jgi:hypothetical protein
MKGPFPKSPAQLQRLLEDFYEKLVRADPRSMDKITIGVLESLPALLDSLLKNNSDTQIYYSANKRDYGGLNRDVYDYRDSIVSEEQMTYDLLTPTRPNSIFNITLRTSSRVLSDYNLDYVYLPPHTPYLLQAPMGDKYRKQFFSLLRQQIKPNSVLGQPIITVTAFEYLILRFLRHLYNLPQTDYCSLKSNLTQASGYKSVGHLLFNEYLEWFRNTDQLGGADHQTAQAGSRLLYSLAEEYLLSPAVLLGPTITLPRTVIAGLLTCITPSLLLVASPHSVRR